jgi:2-aminoadipate transaminase
MLKFQGFFAKRAQNFNASDIKEAFHLAERPSVIYFAGGFPGPHTFPREIVKKLLEKVVSERGESSLQYAPTEGVSELRKLLAREMTREGVAADASDILITSGSQQGLDLLCKAFIDPGDVVLVEIPSYMGALGAMDNYEAVKVGVPLDEEGIRVDLLETTVQKLLREGRTPKLLYLVTNFSNPAGVTLSWERRKKVMELAQKYDFLILEDNPYGTINFAEKLPPHIKTLDEEGRVIYLGSFSKSFMPGIKIGWLCAHSAIIDKLTMVKQGTDLCTNSLGQYLALYFMKEGYLRQHIACLTDIYRKKRDTMLQAMHRYFPAEVSWTEPQGGFFTFVTLPEGINTKTMLAKAVKYDVAYVPGNCFFVNGQGHNTLRLAYSQVELEKIEEGIQRLARVIGEEIDGMRKESFCA